MLIGITSYNSGGGWWGLSIFFRWLRLAFASELIEWIPLQLSKLVVISSVILLAINLKKINIYQHAKYILLVIYIFSFGLSLHYLLWIFPFALITRDSFLKYYALLVGSYLILFGVFEGLNYYYLPPQTPQLLHPFLSFGLWIFFVLWGLKEVRKALNSYIIKGKI